MRTFVLACDILFIFHIRRFDDVATVRFSPFESLMFLAMFPSLHVVFHESYSINARDGEIKDFVAISLDNFVIVLPLVLSMLGCHFYVVFLFLLTLLFGLMLFLQYRGIC